MIGIITHNEIIGSHYWKNAPEKYKYLRNTHRHVFVIRCKFEVSHGDREIEINHMQDLIYEDIRARFCDCDDFGAGVDFGGMSCEQIATWCIGQFGQFGCIECEVLEDGFGGAYVRE